METYKLEINKEEFLGILSEYFTLKLNKPIQAKEEHEVTTNYRGEEVYVRIYYEETIPILGHTAVKTTILQKDQIKGILNELMDNKEYFIDELYYNTSMEWRGYGLDEHQEATFNGVTLHAKEKQKTLRK